MSTIAVTVFLRLAGIAVLHAAWGFGALWPAQTERDLVALVVGHTGQVRMPGMLQCLLAASAIFVSGLVALALAGLIRIPAPRSLVTAVGIFVTLVFVARGIAPYVPAWRREFSQQPFASLDQNWYGPFCLLIAAAFALLVLQRLWTPT